MALQDLLREIWESLGDESSDGLRGRVVESDGVVLLVVEMPVAVASPEALYIASVLRAPDSRLAMFDDRHPRYFVLERTESRDKFRRLELGPDIAHGLVDNRDLDAFVEWVVTEVREPRTISSALDPADLDVSGDEIDAFYAASPSNPARMSMLKAFATYAAVLESGPMLTEQLRHVSGLMWWQYSMKRLVREVFSAQCLGILADEMARADARVAPHVEAAIRQVVQRHFPAALYNLHLPGPRFGGTERLNLTALTHIFLRHGHEPRQPPPEEAYRLFLTQQKVVSRFCAHLEIVG